MLKKQMYVRYAIDFEYPENPRDFILGKVSELNDFSETASLEFYDFIGISQYYQMPERIECSYSKLQHCKIQNGVVVKYNAISYCVQDGYLDEDDSYYYYYLISEDGDVLKACEKHIKANFNSGDISPLKQIKQYEFQNPIWYSGRSAVNKTMHTIDSAFYGFKELAGCKIFLKPYQLKTVMRCLSEQNCRYMIADEVGLGKTIEAASVVKVYLSDKKNKRVLICVPDALTEQWKTELAFKFRMFNGENSNGNIVNVVPLSKVAVVKENYDFIVIDEVHTILKDIVKYTKVLRLSRTAENVIMLSATPVQSRNEEYHKLLSLIQPDKYYEMSDSDFLALLDLQNKIVRKVYSVIEYIDDYKETIEESDKEHNEDTKDAFDELVDALEEIADRTDDDTISEDIDKLEYASDDFSILKLEKIVAYICEAYQLERCIIRNRKKSEDTNIRELHEIPYEMDSDVNNTEYRIYSLLSEWISLREFNNTEYISRFLPLIGSFFSSSFAFVKALKDEPDISEEIIELSGKWMSEDKNAVKNIRKILDDPDDSMSRLVSICDYLEEETYDKKVILFTHYAETHNLYKQVLINLFGSENCAFFSDGMSTDDLELNTYRFQNDEKYRIMLSDETGGEGRNFQMADELICIDLPWSANTLEQRIGRLDRIGRDKTKRVKSVIVYSKDTVEADLVAIWNNGLNVFNRSQSGLEIIMNDIDEQIQTAVTKDFKYGLSSIIDDMITEIQTLEKRVKEERHFDITAYQYQSVNKQIEKIVEKYNENESELFRNSMMSWAALTGFHASRISDDVVRFKASSFSQRSAYNTLFVPPDMKAITEDKLNQMQNHIRVLNGDKEIQKDLHIIQGTFNRNTALKNDYLHFFAPGDDIFDSIVYNAVSAYKGKSTAYAVMGNYNWEGFVFNFYMHPDELILLQNNITIKRINQYRGFLHSDIVSVFVSIDNPSSSVDQNIKRELGKLFQMSVTDVRNCFAHLGKRSPGKDFLGIKEKYAISNLEWFKEKYPDVIWNEKVSDCYKSAKLGAFEEIKKKIRIKSLKETLDKELCSCIASSEYFGSKVDVQRRQKNNEIILESFKKPKFILDSVCYVRMIKND